MTIGNFTFTETDIDGVYVIESKRYGDARGYFFETYKKSDFDAAGLKYDFLQDNQSSSRKGVLRGVHFQKAHPQAKLVRVLKGEVFDVAVDLRKGSKVEPMVSHTPEIVVKKRCVAITQKTKSSRPLQCDGCAFYIF